MPFYELIDDFAKVCTKHKSEASAALHLLTKGRKVRFKLFHCKKS